MLAARTRFIVEDMGRLATEREDSDGEERRAKREEVRGMNGAAFPSGDGSWWPQSGPSGDEPTSFYVNESFLPQEFSVRTDEVAHDIVEFIVQHADPAPAPCKTAAIMRALVDDALRNRTSFMHDMVLRVWNHRHD